MRALPTTTSRAKVAIVEVDDNRAGTLHLYGQLVDHIVEAQPRLVVRVLLDYAGTVNCDLTVLTRHADGRVEVHQLHPDGGVALVRRPSTSSDSAGTPGREHRRSSKRKVWAPNPRGRALVANAWKWTRRRLDGHGLWLMLGAQILLLAGSLTYIVVALAPYLSPSP